MTSPSLPVERIAYVFTDPTDAKNHLHSLWLREFECRAIVNGLERRMDADYQPPPPRRPAWSGRSDCLTLVTDVRGRLIFIISVLPLSCLNLKMQLPEHHIGKL